MVSDVTYFTLCAEISRLHAAHARLTTDLAESRGQAVALATHASAMQAVAVTLQQQLDHAAVTASWQDAELATAAAENAHLRESLHQAHLDCARETQARFDGTPHGQDTMQVYHTREVKEELESAVSALTQVVFEACGVSESRIGETTREVHHMQDNDDEEIPLRHVLEVGEILARLRVRLWANRSRLFVDVGPYEDLVNAVVERADDYSAPPSRAAGSSSDDDDVVDMFRRQALRRQRE